MNGGETVLMHVGLDVHKKVCYGTVMDENGTVVRQGKFSNDSDTLYDFMDGPGWCLCCHGVRVLLAATLRGT